MRLSRPLAAAGIAVAVLSPGPARAGTAVEIKPVADVRLRFEHVDQAGFASDAEALTARARFGAEIGAGDFTLLAEGESTVAPVERYDSGLNGKTRFPLVADPENVELNRLQLQYRGVDEMLVTVGRQRINLDDQRWVGASGWRDNEQTFDAARIEYSGIRRLKADLTYAWSDRTIWGMDGRGGRQQAIGGDNVFANLSYAAPFGTLTGFAYLVDQNEAAVQGFQLSSQTYGLRLAGSTRLRGAGVSYVASYARQTDWNRNPNDYSADYYLVEGGAELRALKLGAGYEVLGADDGRPLTSVQTPLATLHKFQGWADKFLTTPPNGLRDLYATAGYRWKNAGRFDAIDLQLAYHRFRSDRLHLHYGDEWDAALIAKRGRWTATAKVADYRAEQLATDTRKAWLMLEWSY